MKAPIGLARSAGVVTGGRDKVGVCGGAPTDGFDLNLSTPFLPTNSIQGIGNAGPLHSLDRRRGAPISGTETATH